MKKPNFEIAQLLASKVFHDSSTRAPRGFRTLGEGISRRAILAPDGLVYKVGDSYDNEAEYHNIKNIKSRNWSWEGFKFRIPNAALLPTPRGSILVMEHVERQKGSILNCDCGWSDRARCVTTPRYGRCVLDIFHHIEIRTDIHDVHAGNVILDPQNRFNLIDLVF